MIRPGVYSLDFVNRRIAHSILVYVVALVSAGTLTAQQFPAQSASQTALQSPATPAETTSPSLSTGLRLIRFSGRALDATGQPVTGMAGVTFAIYEGQNGGAPLWQETQNLSTDSNGRFSALLGVASPEGISTELFSNGDERWLAVLTHSPGVSEQPRILLVSVPYAMQAANAQTLAGLPATAFVLADSARINNSNSAASGVPDKTVGKSMVVTGAKPGYLPVFTDAAGDMINSGLYQSGPNVGIGTAVPDHPLTVAGAIHSTKGGFVFPDGSVLTSVATVPSLQPDGDLNLASGSGASGAGNLQLQTAGDVANKMSNRLLIAGKPKAMSGVVPMANLFSLHLPAGEAAGGKVKFTLVASDGTNYAMETGEIVYLASPQQLTCAVVISQIAKFPPSYTNSALAVPQFGQSGSLNVQCSPATFGNDPGLQIFDTAPTSFKPSVHKVYYTIENQSQAVLTLQP